MKLVLLGAPGAGKGTIAQPLSVILGVPTISTGEIFRNNIREKTKLGELAKQYIDNGELVPDDVTNMIVHDRISHDDCKNGFILDGYPRTTNQAQNFDESLSKIGDRILAAINICLEDDIIIQRLANRRVCSKCGETYNIEFKMPVTAGICDICGSNVVQRDDDNEQTIKKRLNTYHLKTQPLVEYYGQKGILMNIDNSLGKQASVDTILKMLSKIAKGAK